MLTHEIPLRHDLHSACVFDISLRVLTGSSITMWSELVERAYLLLMFWSDPSMFSSDL